MEDAIQVVCRVRPLAQRERGHASCLTVDSSSSVITVQSKPLQQQFTFDYVVGEDSSQETIFANVGQPLTDACLQGFNGTILAYGQTGSGKTHTLFGGSEAQSRGLVPRVLEYLWQQIAAKGKGAGSSDLEGSADDPSYTCKCSFYEIYNEKVFDLLSDASASASTSTSASMKAGDMQQKSLDVREDPVRGVFVDGVTETVVSSSADALNVLSTGYKNRHTGATSMNRESSRSHAVFLLTIETTSGAGGLRRTRSASFSLVDLAGSERQKDTGAEGVRFKEATKINKSLLTLGSVIHSLSEPTLPGAPKYIRYRDSTLTFLLRDSLGGNSKTVLVAAVSPSLESVSETLSTLKFAQRAKNIKNTVTANITTEGSVEALQREIAALRSRLLVAEGVSVSVSPTRGARRSIGGRLSFGPADANASGANDGPCSSSSSSSSSASSGGASSKATSACGEPLPALFDAALLSEAMDRAKYADEERLRALLDMTDLKKRLEQAERSALQTKMMGKMRDSEIQRLRKANAPSDASAEGKENNAASASASAHELHQAELLAVREELSCEALKYKLECQKLGREVDRLKACLDSASVREGFTQSVSGYTFYSILAGNASSTAPADASAASASTTADTAAASPESLFQHALLSRVQDCEQTLTHLTQRHNATTNAAFMHEIGLSVEEARKIKLDLELSESKSAEFRASLLTTQQILHEANAALAQAKAEAAASSAKHEEAVMDLHSKVAELEGVLSEQRARNKEQLEGGKRTEQELVEAARMRESEARERYNNAMKDNAKLMKRVRELEAALDVAQTALAAEQASLTSEGATVASLQSDLAASQESAAALEASLAAVQSSLCETHALLGASQENLAVEQAETSELRAALEAAQSSWSETQQALEVEQARTSELQSQLLSSQSEVTSTKSALEASTTLNADTQAAFALEQEKVSALHARVESAEASFGQAQARVEEEQARVAFLESELSATQARSIELQQSLEAEQTASSALQATLLKEQQNAISLQVELSGAQEALAAEKASLAIEQQKAATLEGELSAAQTSLAVVEQALAHLQVNSEAAAAAAASAREAANASLTEEQAAHAASTEKAAALTSELEASVARVVEVEAALVSAHAQVSTLQTCLETAEASCCRAQAAFVQEQHRAASLESDVSGLQAALAAAQDRVLLIDAELSSTQTSLSCEQERCTGLQSELASAKTSYASLQAFLDSEQQKAESLDASLAAAESRHTSSQSALEAANASIATAQATIAETAQKLDAQIASHQALEAELALAKQELAQALSDKEALQVNLDGINAAIKSVSVDHIDITIAANANTAPTTDATTTTTTTTTASTNAMPSDGSDYHALYTDAKDRLDALTIEHNLSYLELKTLREEMQDVEGLRRAADKAARRVARLTSERDASTEQAAALSLSLAEQQLSLSSLTQQLHSSQSEATQLTQTIDALTLSKAQLNKTVTELQSQISTLQSEISGHTNSRQKIHYTQQMKKEIEDLHATIRAKQSESHEKDQQIEALHKQLRKLDGDKKSEAVGDAIKECVLRKSVRRGLAQGKENTLASLGRGAGGGAGGGVDV